VRWVASIRRACAGLSLTCMRQWRRFCEMLGGVGIVRRAGSSVVERSIAARRVTGSIPVPRFLLLPSPAASVRGSLRQTFPAASPSSNEYSGAC